MRIFVATRGYPSGEKIYNHGFVHRRVLAYHRAGHEVAVFVIRHRQPHRTYAWEGVGVDVGSAEIAIEHLNRFAPDAIAAHAPADDFGPLLRACAGAIPTTGWIYGAELIPFHRVTERADDDPERAARAAAMFERRLAFWRRLTNDWPARLRLAFVSAHARAAAQAALGRPVPHAVVSPTPIDTDLFAYEPKPATQRYRVLSIRPFSDWRYANDLSVAAVQRLRARADFDRFDFRFVGEGRLFERLLAPIAGLPNVRVEERFLTQSEVAAAHREAGLFLCPSREDAQGVSRDEAMASGLVPVTTAVGAVPEFVDASSGALVPPEDADALAAAIGEMADDPVLFAARSRGAAERVRRTIGIERMIAREIELLATAPC
ncbi:glycosyltransferase family 4 protein [Sphingomicrobium astaxanthinifaciens]|uniref:glycosyltransferase family 4 protein n=1 Tax=Sphingomicrobium astaxanthinifaciens TaxID=1227949 RepID=UPI001FCA826F|nr:glycosyltransferase [Sphingomicrobium astaxanthinifaciens]MCJ7420786.1 glycosyltransferase [Sphingomicrobium astaxanthinifaciens]